MRIRLKLNSAGLNVATGFTLIEAVIVITLIGIISVVTISRFLGGNAFNPLAVQGQIVSMIRAGQQSALGRNDVEVTLTPNGTGTELTVELEDISGAIETQTVELRGVTLSGDVNDTDSCEVTSGATTISSGSPMILRFEELGDLGNSGFGAGTAVTTAVRICVNNDADFSVCVSPAGFAYEGNCDV